MWYAMVREGAHAKHGEWKLYYYYKNMLSMIDNNFSQHLACVSERAIEVLLIP